MINFHDKVCEVFDKDGTKLMGVEMHGHSFPLKWRNEAAYHVSMDETMLWHKRYGHYNFKALKLMADSHMVINLPTINITRNICCVCEEGKSHRQPFPTQQTRRALRRLELVYTDIYGPMHTNSLNGSKYFLLFIDDFSRYAWVYFMKQKTEVFDWFVKFKAMVENEVGEKIKVLRSDNGAEYVSNQFQCFLQKHGVQHQLTVPYSPQ